ncbi:hypothetical protein [Variovorax sp. LjRoot178]|uniref:hypothetical protein n=1 Tax=Variovorax sp. LjRoot178 TaxID=3342277 RepID=UPI003ED0AAE2
MNRAAGGANAPSADRPEPLSRFEGRCLYRRTCECDEALQLAVLGVERTHGRHGDDPTLSLIAELLRDAAYAVQQARRLAQRWQD